MKRAMFFWLLVSAIVMLGLPWLANNFVSADAGMAVCFLLFFVVNPIYAVIVGIFAGKDMKCLWMQPIVTVILFLLGVVVFLGGDVRSFVTYAIVYLVLGILAAMFSGVARKKERQMLS
ncbi:MAG: hypothetical protein HFG82_12430 [Dorea sp.]|jgi:hypothetical protein|nr:hypothetical protein [Dorea sp.]